MYLSKATITQALEDLKGSANPLLKVWLTLKAMGLNASTPVLVDTTNSKPALKALFNSGDPEGRFYIPFSSTQSDAWMSGQASRSIIQTTIKKWLDGTITTVDPRGYLIISKSGRKYKVELASAYPIGLGEGQNGFARNDGLTLSVPMAQFAVWVFCRDSIPDGTTNVNDYLCAKLRTLLHLDSAEESRVFGVVPFNIATSNEPVTDENVFTLCGGKIQPQVVNADAPKFLDVSLRLFAKQRAESTWLTKGRLVNAITRSHFQSITDAGLLELDAQGVEDFFCKTELIEGATFEPMWAGKVSTGWSSIQPDTPQKLQEVTGLLSRLCHDTAVGALYWQSDFERPSGFGPSVVTELLMKFHPDSCFKYGSVTRKVFERLKLVEYPCAWKSDFPEIEYRLACGAAAYILGKMREMNLPRSLNVDGTSDGQKADYLTVNEFVWWASDEDNQKKISKECEVKKMKAADYSTSEHQPTAKKAKVNLAKKEDVVLLRLCAALRAKPFAILAGHSGTGKSRMVRQLAYMTAAAHNHRALFEDANGQRLTVPGNFCMVQVKPNWHDSTDLLGFYSEMKGAFKGTDFVKFICRAYAYPDVPFFVCLDEMNLAPVEHYFAEYLSAIESRKLVKDVETMDKGGNVVKTETVMTDRLLPDEAWRNSNGAPDYSGLGCEYNQSQCWLEKHGLTIPRNLFVVGTVNMDESTNQFTRKVLDRAFTLEMTDADFEHFGESDPEPTFDDFAGDDFADALLSGAMIAKKPEPTAAQDDQARFKKQIENLTALKPVLDGTSFVVAYRFANEYMLYESAFAEMRKVMDVSSLASAQQGTASANPAYEPEAFDDMILMKLLPRISGDQAVVMRIFVGESDPNKDSKKLDDADVGGLAKLLKQKGASFEKMQEIVRRGEANGGETLTFWP